MSESKRTTRSMTSKLKQTPQKIPTGTETPTTLVKTPARTKTPAHDKSKGSLLFCLAANDPTLHHLPLDELCKLPIFKKMLPRDAIPGSDIKRHWRDAWNYIRKYFSKSEALQIKNYHYLNEHVKSLGSDDDSADVLPDDVISRLLTLPDHDDAAGVGILSLGLSLDRRHFDISCSKAISTKATAGEEGILSVASSAPGRAGHGRHHPLKMDPERAEATEDVLGVTSNDDHDDDFGPPPRREDYDCFYDWLEAMNEHSLAMGVKYEANMIMEEEFASMAASFAPGSSDGGGNTLGGGAAAATVTGKEGQMSTPGTPSNNRCEGGKFSTPNRGAVRLLLQRKQMQQRQPAMVEASPPQQSPEVRRSTLSNGIESATKLASEGIKVASKAMDVGKDATSLALSGLTIIQQLDNKFEGLETTVRQNQQSNDKRFNEIENRFALTEQDIDIGQNLVLSLVEDNAVLDSTRMSLAIALAHKMEKGLASPLFASLQVDPSSSYGLRLDGDTFQRPTFTMYTDMNFEQQDAAGIIAPHTHNTLLVLQQPSHSLKVPESMSTGQTFNYSEECRYLYVPYQQFRIVRTCQVEDGLDDPITGRFKFEGEKTLLFLEEDCCQL